MSGVYSSCIVCFQGVSTLQYMSIWSALYAKSLFRPSSYENTVCFVDLLYTLSSVALIKFRVGVDHRGQQVAAKMTRSLKAWGKNKALAL